MSIDRRALPVLMSFNLFPLGGLSPPVGAVSNRARTGAQPNLENLANPACKSKQDSQDLHDEQDKRVYLIILKIEAGAGL